jgi:hypothetical protein
VAIRSGQPISVEIVSAISSCRFARPSRIRRRNSARSLTVVCDQDGNAARAAATARSTSAAAPAGTVASTCSVLGFSTSITSDELGDTQSPFM